ncbi:Major Facilitator Superfamily protein [Candidatus Burarchaeum australiense]|nr:Major Facilitator Superfamily protein [Candidatus Burarchaeum australiense]
MGEEKTLGEQAVKSSLGASVRDGVLFSLMTGLGDAYMPALLLFYGATDAAIGLLTSIPYLFSAFAQLLISKTMGAWRNRKNFVTRAVFFHAFFWLAQIALVFSPFDVPLKITLAIAVFALYAGFDDFIYPIWSGWIADLVPEGMRGQYFGYRNKITGLALFLATLGGGLVLGFFTGNLGNALLGFAVLFFLAFLCRLGSAWFIMRMAAIPGSGKEFRTVSWNTLLFHDAWKNARLFIAGAALISFTRYVASPFYSVFMLRNMGLGYAEFGILTSAAVLFKIISFPYWGKLADRFGNRAVLVVSGILVSVLPLPWAFFARFDVLLCTQVLSGFAWSGFELVSFNYILSSAPREQRVSLVSRYNFFNNVAIVVGATFGAFLLSGVLPQVFLGLVALQLLFFISSALRMLVALFMLPRVKEQHAIYPYNDMGFMLDASVIYPAQSVARHVARGIRFAGRVRAPLRSARRAALDAFEKGRKKIRRR